MNKSEALFDIQLLKVAKFPRMTDTGLRACRHEVQLWGFQQFLEDGWTSIQEDKVITGWLKHLIQVEQEGIHPEIHSQIDLSIRYGASIVYYPLYLQAISDGNSIPRTAIDQTGSMRFDLNQEDNRSFGIFLAAFDPELAALIGGFLKNERLLESLGIDQDHAYLGAYFTYFALAYKGQKDGLRIKFGE